jgi:hypothetical protein
MIFCGNRAFVWKSGTAIHATKRKQNVVYYLDTIYPFDIIWECPKGKLNSLEQCSACDLHYKCSVPYTRAGMNKKCDSCRKQLTCLMLEWDY